MSTTSAPPAPRRRDVPPPQAPVRRPHRRCGTVARLLLVLALVWLFPLGWARPQLVPGLRLHPDNGYLCFGGWTFENYADAWSRGNFGPNFLNSIIITVPAVLLTLFLASLHGVRAGPVQLPLQPDPARGLPRREPAAAAGAAGAGVPAVPADPSRVAVRHRHHARQPLGLILVNVAFQLGFCTFVLSNYMKTMPFEIYESAQIDGAGVLRQYWQLTLPLIRPALAALAMLQITWIYNEFFWATVLIQASTSSRSRARLTTCAVSSSPTTTCWRPVR